MNRIFLDTAFAIATVSRRDQFHQKAVFWLNRIETNSTPLVTTQAVLLEIGNAMSKSAFRQVGAGLLNKLKNDPNTRIFSLTDELYDQAFELFSSRADKEWGLVDCVSFVVMEAENIEAALTTDEHFLQAGFRALLLEE